MIRLTSAAALVLTLAGCTTGTASTTTPQTFPKVDTTVAEAPVDIQTPPVRSEALAYDAPPPMIIDTTAAYSATIVTNYGEIEVDLYADQAPVTVNNFVFLARDDYFGGVIFHRIAPGFVIQGGDPTGTGRGGPGYSFADELNGEGNYTRGVLAMANSGANTNGSQFFIMLDTVELEYLYNIFGEVTSGMDTVDAIAAVPRAGETPIDPVVIIDVVIEGP